MYVSIFGQFCAAILSSSLWNNSREKFLQVLKKSSGHSRDIQAVSCEMWSEMWRWVALLVDGLRDFCVKQSSAAKWSPSARQSNTKTEATCPVP